MPLLVDVSGFYVRRDGPAERGTYIAGGAYVWVMSCALRDFFSWLTLYGIPFKTVRPACIINAAPANVERLKCWHCERPITKNCVVR